MAPQSQFESLVSEPEKSVYVPLRKKRIPIISSSHHRSASQTTCLVAEAGSFQKKSSCRFCDNRQNQRGFYSVDPNKNVEDIRYLDETEDRRSRDGSDIDEYFHKSLHERYKSNDHRILKRTRESSENAGTVTAAGTKNERRVTEEEAKAELQLAEGHVGQKISAYEQNARRSLRDPGPRYRSLFEVKGHRTIGVPLVGMHNACGLPVVASWHDRELLDSLRISRRITGPIYKSPRTIPNVRRRTQPKRKAPQPDRGMVHPKDIGVKKLTIKSTEYLDGIDSGRSRRKHRRSSFTTTKVGSLSSKNSFKRKMPRRCGIKASSLVDTFGKRSIKEGSAKRTTLYAKDDGEEPVQVLKSLCLNPLARANPETDMMW
ncbi:hypothetical protein P5V15_011858 [Pogonomyrmex californicus]